MLILSRPARILPGIVFDPVRLRQGPVHRVALRGLACLLVALAIAGCSGHPAAAKTLTVVVALNPWPAGSAHSVTAKALDAYGNVATGYTGTIHFTTSDTMASVPADYKFTAVDKGVHTFPNSLKPGLSLKTAGAQWLRATDTGTASITGVQSGIVVK
jgi:hypothetical protein